MINIFFELDFIIIIIYSFKSICFVDLYNNILIFAKKHFQWLISSSFVSYETSVSQRGAQKILRGYCKIANRNHCLNNFFFALILRVLETQKWVKVKNFCKLVNTEELQTEQYSFSNVEILAKNNFHSDLKITAFSLKCWYFWLNEQRSKKEI